MNSIDLKRLLETSDEKYSILTDRNILSEYNISAFDITNLATRFLTNEQRISLLQDTDFALEKLTIPYIKDIVMGLNVDDKVKIDIIESYDFNIHQINNILTSFSVDSLVNLFSNKEFLQKYKIQPYKVTKGLTYEKQLDFISRFEELDFDIDEKRKILATLSKTAKDNIDISNLSEEYITAIEMQVSDDFSNYDSLGKIIVDFNSDLERYRGLDELIFINPMNMSSEDRTKMLSLCEICPRIDVSDNIRLGNSTAEDYINAEKWIESVLKGINEDWTEIQKIAFIDNAIGKKISYSPDFDTEVSNDEEARALWKIINSGYGICNGIAQVEKYILSRVGVEAEIISGKKHAFLKLKNIEFINADGEIKSGNTILDPTWNLTAHRYGAKPENFCRSYEAIRKNDIRDDGSDSGCHKNDNQLADATLELDEPSLRQVFRSIGIADKEGNFPIKELIDKAKAIDDEILPSSESIQRQFLLLKEYYPEFATCHNETANILQGVLLNQENLKFNRCVVNRVYERNDTDKKPVLYVYIDLPEEGKKFYFVDKEASEFIELSTQEFESRFECYDMDLEKQGGYRPWEDAEIPERPKDLAQSSGKIAIDEGGR